MSNEKRPNLKIVAGVDGPYPPRSTPPGGDPPDDMEKRLAALEGDVKDIRERLIKVEGKLDHMPTTLQMWCAVGARFVGAAVTFVGGMYWLVKTLIATPQGQAFLAVLLNPPST